jgi:hypothetical protein
MGTCSHTFHAHPPTRPEMSFISWLRSLASPPSPAPEREKPKMNEANEDEEETGELIAIGII